MVGTSMSENEEKVMPESERTKELKDFDDTKAGVKGLVDAGITKIPSIFYHPPDNFKKASDLGYTEYIIPVIDLANIHQDPSARKSVVERVRDASETWGFFQVINHGIPVSSLNEMKNGVLRFFEQGSEVKKEFYTREQRPFMYNSNFNLYSSAPTSWKDSFFYNLAPNAPKPEDIPAVCRDILVEYSNQVMKLGTLLFELLSEALGLNPTHLIDIGCTEGLFAFSHYYPPCPEPELTLGTMKHADVDFITVLLQDHVGGLQVLHQDMWIDLPPLPGALLVNIGNFLQLISNDKFKSPQHRVLANHIGPRVSVACFFSTGCHPSQRNYGPIKELLSKENPAKYRETSISDFVLHFSKNCMNGTSPLLHFRID
ncbi:1-aminocyclopropane-1-carboxylate oxidase homolog 1-like [Gastrolobium bilobum]|uniref:1-aminocyclopropane-1-carboxylate oxidase homolog 1-like n=1 Tax=Gastrolobium bilobum TaxID=150636 RepID=UPI002AB16BEE|nr:1-aminocyclopropane-1-carboxylate oxidase homolog 1-like [Gastrolobium bilobum]